MSSRLSLPFALDLSAEHVIELGKLRWLVVHGTDDCLALGSLEFQAERSLDLLGHEGLVLSLVPHGANRTV